MFWRSLCCFPTGPTRGKLEHVVMGFQKYIFQEIGPTGPTFHGPRKNLSIKKRSSSQLTVHGIRWEGWSHETFLHMTYG